MSIDARQRARRRGVERDDDARAFLLDRAHRTLKHARTRPGLAEHVGKQVEAVHPDQHGRPGSSVPWTSASCSSPLDLSRNTCACHCAPLAGGEGAGRDPLDQMVLLQPVGDEVADGADLEAVGAGEIHQIVEPGHGRRRRA